MIKKIKLSCEEWESFKHKINPLIDCEKGELTLHITKIECDPSDGRGGKKKGTSKR